MWKLAKRRDSWLARIVNKFDNRKIPLAEDENQYDLIFKF